MSENKNRRAGLDYLVKKSANMRRVIEELKTTVEVTSSGITNFVVNHENPLLVESILLEAFKTSKLFNETVKFDAVELQHGRPGKGSSVRYFDELIYGTYKNKTNKDGEQVPDMDEQLGIFNREENGLTTRASIKRKIVDSGCEDRICIISNMDYSLDFCKTDHPGQIDTRALFLLDKFRHPTVRNGCALILVTNKRLDLPFPVNTVEINPVSKFEVIHILNIFIKMYRDQNVKLLINESEASQITRKLTGLTYCGACDALAYCTTRAKTLKDGVKIIDMAKVLKLLRTKVNKDLMDGGFGLAQLEARPWEDYICPEQSNFTYDVKKLMRDFKEVERLTAERKSLSKDLKSEKKQSAFDAGLERVGDLEKDIEDIQTRMPHVIVLHGQGGVGKCLGRGTKVIMFDGSIKAVEDVEVGDTLMGPNSKPRAVLSTTYGIGPLYRVSQKNGKDYICNDKHILSLQKEGTKNNDKEVFISVEDYLQKNETWKKTHYGWKSGVKFKKRKLPIDPYWMGLWLGDGNSVKSAIIVGDKDPEIKEWLTKWASKNKCFIRKEKNRGAEILNFSYRVGSGYTDNPILNSLRELNVYGSKCKHIPELYLRNSSKNRLMLLAGLIDSDGYMTKTGTLQFTNVNKKLALNALYLVRSLGFKGFWSESTKTLKSIDYSVKAYTVSIGGDLSRIPTKLKRKKGHNNPQKKSLKCGINVEPIGKGEYFGFTIDDDHQFLLEDFTVTHNSAFPIHLAGLLDMDVWDFNVNATHSKWIGQGGEQMRESLEKITQSSHIILRIDEYDRAMGSTNERGGGMHEAHKQVESEFMNWLQNSQEDNIFAKRNIFVVMTTNHVDNITGPMLRSGRADLVIDIGSFDSASMREAFETCARRMHNRGVSVVGFKTPEDLQKEINNLDMEKLSELAMTKKFTVRDIEMLIIEMAAHRYYYNKHGEGAGIPWTSESFIKVLENSEGSVKGASTGELKLGDRDFYTEDPEDLKVEFEDSVSHVDELKKTTGFKEV